MIRNPLALSVLLAGSAALIPRPVWATTLRIDPSGDLAAAVASLAPGDDLVLADGVYHQPLVVGVSGTADSPITIRSENDGRAIIDGLHDPARLWTVRLSGDHLVLRGVVARNGGGTPVAIEGNHVTAQRVTAYSAMTGALGGQANSHVFTVTGTNVLLEDCAGAGSGRYIFLAYSTDHVTFRRCFAHWSFNDFEDAPRAAFGIYGASNVTLENCVGTHVVPTSSTVAPVQYAGVYVTKNSEPHQRPPVNATIRGSVFHDVWELGVLGNVPEAENLRIEDSVFIDVYDKEPCTYQDPSQCDRRATGSFFSSSPTGAISGCTFAESEHGVWIGNDSNPTLDSSSFVGNAVAHRGRDVSHSHVNFWGNGAISLNDALTLNGTTTELDPAYDLAKYGRGAYLFVPETSPLHAAGAKGRDVGANVLYQLENGVLGSRPLWPWPLEDRIQEETERELGQRISPTWASMGGLWKRLDGVYPAGLTPEGNGGDAGPGGAGGGSGATGSVPSPSATDDAASDCDCRQAGRGRSHAGAGLVGLAFLVAAARSASTRRRRT